MTHNYKGMRIFLGYWLLAAACMGQYVGSQVCAKCHPEEFAAQARSGHALALQPSDASQQGQWAFGAGNQAVTFVGRINESDYLEYGETWYTATKRFDITPGHSDREGLRYRIFDPSAGILRCFSCHSTGPLQVTAKGEIQPHEAGVRCEVCHGPGEQHAAHPARVRMKNPGAMNGAEMNAACGACHRVQSSAEDGSNLLDPWNSRHQPLLLAASACFQKSAGKLTCVTCHSPHEALEVKQSAYNPVCMNCHANAKHTVTITDRPCSECHMPSVRINENLAFANHRIAVYSPADPLLPVTASGGRSR
jgi:hypothetical protein